MKKTLFAAVITAGTIISCTKNNDVATTTLTPSATTVSVGETVTVQATSPTNAISWTVNPSATVSKQYGITTQKTNRFTFSQPGNYMISVRARDIDYDSTKHQDIDSCWHHGKGDKGGCHHGRDSASVVIKVI